MSTWPRWMSYWIPRPQNSSCVPRSPLWAQQRRLLGLSTTPGRPRRLRCLLTCLERPGRNSASWPARGPGGRLVQGRSRRGATPCRPAGTPGSGRPQDHHPRRWAGRHVLERRCPHGPGCTPFVAVRSTVGLESEHRRVVDGAEIVDRLRSQPPRFPEAWINVVFAVARPSDA